MEHSTNMVLKTKLAHLKFQLPIVWVTHHLYSLVCCSAFVEYLSIDYVIERPQCT